MSELKTPAEAFWMIRSSIKSNGDKLARDLFLEHDAAVRADERAKVVAWLRATRVYPHHPVDIDVLAEDIEGGHHMEDKCKD